MKPELLPNVGLSKDFCWTDRDLLFPCAFGGRLNKKVYLLSDFLSAKDYVYVTDFDSPEEMLAYSLELHEADSLTFKEWRALWQISRPYPNSFAKLCPAYMLNKHKEIFTTAEAWSDALLDYLSTKAQLWKSALLIAKMPQMTAYIEGFIRQKPSVQEFRQFVEEVRDFSDVLTGTYEAENHRSLTDRISPQHRQALAFFSQLEDLAAPVRLQMKDNFETGSILWSFEASAYDELEGVIEKLKAVLPALRRYHV